MVYFFWLVSSWLGDRLGYKQTPFFCKLVCKRKFYHELVLVVLYVSQYIRLITNKHATPLLHPDKILITRKSMLFRLIGATMLQLPKDMVCKVCFNCVKFLQYPTQMLKSFSQSASQSKSTLACLSASINALSCIALRERWPSVKGTPDNPVKLCVICRTLHIFSNSRENSTSHYATHHPYLSRHSALCKSLIATARFTSASNSLAFGYFVLNLQSIYILSVFSIALPFQQNSSYLKRYEHGPQPSQVKRSQAFPIKVLPIMKWDFNRM